MDPNEARQAYIAEMNRKQQHKEEVKEEDNLAPTWAVILAWGSMAVILLIFIITIIIIYMNGGK